MPWIVWVRLESHHTCSWKREEEEDWITGRRRQSRGVWTLACKSGLGGHPSVMSGAPSSWKQPGIAPARACGKSKALPAAVPAQGHWSHTLGLHNLENIDFCCFPPPSLCQNVTEATANVLTHVLTEKLTAAKTHPYLVK